MKVILHQDIEKVGREGEVVNVADGYARNYLFPRKLAIAAVGGALKDIQHKQALVERRAERQRTSADEAKTKLEGKTVTVNGKTGTGSRLYGSITAQDIADAIQSEHGITVDKRKVLLTDPIKALGTYTVPVKLHRDITLPVTVEVAATPVTA